jgi:nucleotide-binding universal stress UspA family protein
LWVGDLADHARVVSGLSLPVSTDVVDGLPTKALLEESRRSSMVVLGSRDLGRLGRVLLGSTAAEVAARASSPVVVIPRGAEPSPHRTGIVVGVDGARESEAALKFAFAWAHRHDARLTALHAWDAPGRGMRRAASAADDALEAAAEDLLARTLAPWRKHYPGVLVDAKVVRGTAIGELGRASADAQLVVVGARFRSAWAVAAPGSVSQALLHSATGPVAVVRASEQDASRSPA